MNRQVPIMVCKWHLHITAVFTKRCINVVVNRNVCGGGGGHRCVFSADDFRLWTKRAQHYSMPLLGSIDSNHQACKAAQKGGQEADTHWGCALQTIDRPRSTNCCIPLLHSLQRSRQHRAHRPAGRPSWKCTTSSPCSAPQPDPAHTHSESEV